MDYSEMLVFHVEKGADLTIACIEADLTDARRFGVVEVDADNRILGFEEKPASPKPLPTDPTKALASMGIYVFNTEKLIRRVIEDSKRDTAHDFGKNVIPDMVAADRVYAWPFEDENKKPVQYWRDIGTIDAYLEANLDLVAVDPIFNLYDREWPIRTYFEQYPPAKTVFADEYEGGRRAVVLDSIIAPGCIISGGCVERSVLSFGCRVEEYAHVENSVLMDDVKVGKGARLRRAIVDKRVVIPDGMSIGYNREQDAKRFLITDSGVCVVPKEMPLGSA
jgi:glucose-1-phosphate adenylyltransferase